MRSVELVAVLALAAGSAVVGGCGNGAEEEAAEEVVVRTAPPPGARALPGGVSAAMAEEGQALFEETCVVCHGPDAGGTQLGPSLVDDEWINISGEFEEIVRLIHTGVEEPEEHPVPMPPLGGGDYTEEEIRALAAYVYSLGH